MFTTRKSVKVLLINDDKELLMLHVDDPKTTSIDGKTHGCFFCPVGGKIEEGESLHQAALREIWEETGIKSEEVCLGPIVWFGEYDFILAGNKTHMKETFIVAKTKKKDICKKNHTEWEKEVVKDLVWLSLNQVKNSKDVVFPVLLSKYLPDILNEEYPEQPIKIDLGKDPS